MTKVQFAGIRACVFDAYGTLFDVHSAVGRYRDRLGGEADNVSATWRTKQLEYTWLRSLMGRFVDFWQITQDGLDYALDGAGIDDAALREDLLHAYTALEPYPEVVDVLSALKERGMRTAVLSNGSTEMLAAAVQNAGLQHFFDGVLSVDEVGVFKPDPRVYQLACDRLELAPEEISFQSSNAWDAAGAATFGFQVAWINRFGQAVERLPDAPAAELKSLRELPALLG